MTRWKIGQAERKQVMARTKSELKSGINVAARVFTRLIEAVEDNGGTDEDIRRIETNDELRFDLAKRIVAHRLTGVSDVYELEVDYDDPAWRTIEREQYAYVG